MDFLHRLWKAWQNIVMAIANVIARVTLTLFYFTIMMPFALGVTLFADLLHIKNPPTPLWRERETPTDTLESVQRQY